MKFQLLQAVLLLFLLWISFWWLSCAFYEYYMHKHIYSIDTDQQVTTNSHKITFSLRTMKSMPAVPPVVKCHLKIEWALLCAIALAVSRAVLIYFFFSFQKQHFCNWCWDNRNTETQHIEYVWHIAKILNMVCLYSCYWKLRVHFEGVGSEKWVSLGCITFEERENNELKLK